MIPDLFGNGLGLRRRVFLRCIFLDILDNDVLIVLLGLLLGGGLFSLFLLDLLFGLRSDITLILGFEGDFLITSGPEVDGVNSGESGMLLTRCG